ncbi:MAG: hypothetical protein IJ664_03040 [Clostridia bacterium]|nr:hypothetical protein [Clostridia bacterium]
MAGGGQVLDAVGGIPLQEGPGGGEVLVVGVHANTGMGEGRNAAHVVGLAFFNDGPGGKAGDEVHAVVGGVGQEAYHVGGQRGIAGALHQEGLLGLQVVAAVDGLGEPDLIHDLGVVFVLQGLDDHRVVEGAGAVLIVVGVLAHQGAVHIGVVVLAVVAGTAVHLHGAVLVVFGHGLGGGEVLVPGPFGGQFAQAGGVPGVHVDGHIVAQAAAGEGVDAVVILEGVAAPVGHQVDALFLHQVGQVHVQAGFPALVGVGQAEGGQHVHFTRQDGGVDGQVAVGVVVVGVQVHLDVGVDGVEVRDQRVHALGALEGHPEGDLAGNGSVVFQDPAGDVFALGEGGERGQQHQRRQQQTENLFHFGILLFI